MLRHMSFTNFKTWEKADISFGRITGLFGTNSSGKSSLVQFLLLLKQTKEATDRAISLALNGPYVNLGTYRDMVHRHDASRHIQWSVLFDRDQELTLIDPSRRRTERLAEGKVIAVNGEVAEKDEGATALRLGYTFGDLNFRLVPKGTSGSAYELTSNGFKFIRSLGRKWQLPGPVKSYAFPDQARTYFQNASFLSDLEAAFEEQIDHVFYLGPLREFPQRDYLWGRSRPQSVGIRGQNTIDAILAATADKEMRNRVRGSKLRPFQAIIAFWLRELGVIHDFKVTEIGSSGRWLTSIQVRKTDQEHCCRMSGSAFRKSFPW